ncbi:MAG: hypothetical protein L0Y66_13020 [Myxococcaceae bacterium]|nr:hypothetical protein [Myxococcaceae bacterium]
MKRLIAASLVSLVLAAPAWAQAQKQQLPAPTAQDAPMDMSKMGPWTRKPTNEAQTRKEIQAFFKEEEAAMKKGDLEATLARIDFPVLMATDDSKGVPSAEMWDRQRYAAEMKPFYEKMPKDMEMTHKPTVTVLSDSLAAVTDDFTMKMGKQKMSGRNAGLLVKKDGQWKWKAMAEAGWGGAPTAGTGGAGSGDIGERK